MSLNPFDFDMDGHVENKISMTDAVGPLSDEQFEKVVEWAQKNIDRFYDCDCDEGGYFECTDYEGMVECALEELGQNTELSETVK
jgi:molecular chaperone DnaK (HSP70)